MAKHEKPIVDFIGKIKFTKRVITDPSLLRDYAVHLNADNSYEYATLYVMNHPALGEDLVRTSIVIKKNKDGSFETLNTVYKPVKEETDE